MIVAQMLEPMAHTRHFSKHAAEITAAVLALPWSLINAHTVKTHTKWLPPNEAPERFARERHPVSEARKPTEEKRRTDPQLRTFEITQMLSGLFGGREREGGEKRENEMAHERDCVSGTSLGCALEDLFAAGTRGDGVGVDGRAVVGFECKGGARSGDCWGKGWRRP
jgi:hypothetical protein